MKLLKSVTSFALAITIGVAIILAGCATADKTAATTTQTAYSSASGFYDYYNISTNGASADKVAELHRQLVLVMNSSKRLGFAMSSYKLISAQYQTNSALKGSVTAALEATSNESSNIVYLIQMFRNPLRI